MGYSIGDVVKFKVGSDEHHGEVRFVDKSQQGDILYINSYSGWAYKVAEKGIVGRILARNRNR